MSTIFSTITSLLDERRIPYALTEHAPVTTSEEAARIRGVELKTGAKAMVAKTPSGYILVVLPADRKVSWRKLKTALNQKNVSLASTEEAETVTGCKRGSVPPFGTLIGIPMYLDPALLENESINFNPGSLNHSIKMSPSDLVTLTNPFIVPVTETDADVAPER